MDPDEVIEQYEKNGITQQVEEEIEDNPEDFLDYLGQMDEEMEEIVIDNL